MAMRTDLQDLLVKNYDDKAIRVQHEQTSEYHIFEVTMSGRKKTAFHISNSFGSHTQILRAAYDAATFNIDLLLRTKK